MIHGVGAALEFWRPLESQLGQFRTITVDPPGSGRSSTPRGRFRMRDFAAVFDDLLTHLGLTSAHVLGLSLGGMMAQELAHRSPERVETLVLASTTCGLGSVPVDPRAWAAIANPARFHSRRHYRKIAPILFGPEILVDPSLLEEFLEIRRRCRPSIRGHYIQLRAAASWSGLPWLRTLRMPVLVISGSDDRLVSVVNARMIASAVSDPRLEIIPGGSHACLLQRAPRTSKLITD